MTEVIKVEDCGENIGNYNVPIYKAIIIPKGVTNGDIIRALFPDAKIGRGLYGLDGIPLICLKLDTRCCAHEMSFVEDWWNAPYKAESEVLNAVSN